MEEERLQKYENLLGTKREFSLFYRFLIEWNEKFNLTAVTEEGEVKIKHFLDSLAGEFLFPDGARVCEVGSGAGFPSIPLMFARPDLRFTLVESTGKKCAFLRAAKEEFGLGAEIVCARAEDLGRDPAFRERFDVVCARAVARLNTLAEYCLPLVKVGGKMVAYKSGDGSETEEARPALSKLGGGEPQTFLYTLPEGYGARRLVVSEKISHTPARYPRGRGAERRDPL